MIFKRNCYTQSLKNGSTECCPILQFCCLEVYLLVIKTPWQCNTAYSKVIVFTEIIIEVL